MKKWIAVIAALVSFAAYAEDKKAPETHVELANVTWTQPFGANGPSFGFVQGKMGDKHPASFYLKVPAGFDSGWHIHNNDYQAVVLKGSFSEQQQGEAQETVVPVNTWIMQKGKTNHRNGCGKDGECLLFIHFDKGADMTPMTADGKKAPPPKAEPAKPAEGAK
jgi:hypothetical protein